MKIALDGRPLAIAIAGPNGAGKSTIYETQLKEFGLPFINADNLARQLDLDPYAAAKGADDLRREFLRSRESFVFETVFSDPIGDKVIFLQSLEAASYQVVLCFVGVSNAAVSDQRVSMRVSKGGHDVPARKIQERFPRILVNLKLAMKSLADVRVFDNDDLAHPYRLVAQCQHGHLIELSKPVPGWLKTLLPRPAKP